MQPNQHKRLARRIVPRFEPTWTGQAVDPTSALAVTSVVASAPALTTSQLQLPTTSVVLPTSNPVVVPTTEAQPTTTATPTSSSVQTSLTSLVLAISDSSTSSVLSTSTTVSVSSSTPLTSSSTPTLAASTPAQTTAAPPTTTTTPPAAAAAATTPSPRSTSLIRSSSSYTNSAGVVVNTIIVYPAPVPTATETEAPTSIGNAGTIVGAVAGGFVGLICLIAFVSWIIRQHNRRKDGNHDDFDRQSYLRNSMMIPDEPDHPVRGTQAALALARSNTQVGPRPPTMIERKNTYYSHPSPAFDPSQPMSFEPGQIVSAPPTSGEPAYPSPVAFAAYTPPEQHHQSELARRPSGAQLLNRAPTNGGMYDHSYAPSPVSFGPDSYRMQSPDSYAHGGYTYPMNPGAVDPRGMVQSVTPFQAQQYAEITRQLESADAGYEHDSFHPISPGPGPASPVGQAVSTSLGSPTQESPLDEHPMPNPFDEKALGSRIDSMPPALPVIESLSRTGTPIDPNPQYAHWSYDSKAQNEGNRLSVAGMHMPEPPTPPAMAVIREDQTVRAPALNVAPARPVSTFDADDAYGGI